MMTALDVFTYSDQQVRTVVIDGEPWFVLADVCRVLGIAQASAVMRRLPDGVTLSHPIVDSLGRSQNATVVSEPGLYRVILRSDAPGAEPFMEWITSDVLPAIRRTGRYGSDAEMLAALPSSKLLTIAAQAAERAEQAEARAKELEAPATRWHEIAGAGGDFPVDQVAKLLVRAGADTGRNRLFQTMADLGWIYRRGDGWHVYQTATGLVIPRANRPVTDLKTGNLRNVAPTIRITGKGVDRLAEHFGIGQRVSA